MDFIASFSVSKEPGSTVTITGEIPFSVLEKERKGALTHLGKNVEVDGFRKGNVPEKILVTTVGEMNILSEMAERALAKVYPLTLKEHKIDAVGHPHVQITKLAEGNPLGFSITVAVLPQITLPDYTTIAKELNAQKESATVTDKDVEDQIKDILRQKVAYEKLQEKAAKKAQSEKEGKTLPTPETVETEEDSSEQPLPELNDEYVKTLGTPGQFENVADFKQKLREHLAIEKEREVNAAHRAKITDAIIEKSVIDLPQILVQSEIEQMFAQMNEDLARANLKMDDYLSHIKKTKEDLIKEWTPAAEKRAKLQLILNDIAQKENIKPDQGQLDQQVDQLLSQYKDADEARVRVYVTSVMTNEAVMKTLESA